MEDCIFCKIIKGEIPSSKVFEDEHVYAFLDIAPINKGHTLVIPKKHCENLFDCGADELKEAILSVQKIGEAVKAGVNADGISIGQSNGKAAGQAVFHLHFHIMPRFSDDGLKHWPSKKYGEGEADKIKDEIAKHL